MEVDFDANWYFFWCQLMLLVYPFLLLHLEIESGVWDLLLYTYSIWEEILPDKSMQNACVEEAISLYNIEKM